MAAKRKPWWHYLRGPRGHRGLPGYDQVTPKLVTVLQQDGQALRERMTELEQDAHSLKDVFLLLRERVAELERKLGGSQK